MSVALKSAETNMIGERRARSLVSARQRSRFVSVLRLVLLTLGGALLLNPLIQILVSGQDTNAAAAPDFTPQGDAERIVNPRFTGRDRSGAPFVITAEAAERRSGTEAGITNLIRPALDYALLENAEDISHVLAENGVFNEAEQSLHLQSRVRMNTRSGYAFQTSAATLYLKDGVVSGNTPVSGQAPWGAVRADSFEVREEGNHIILRGDVRTRFLAPEPQSEPNAQPPGESKP